MLSEGQSVGVSGVSTMGGVPTTDQAAHIEFNSQVQDQLRPDNHIQRKNSSILSTANRNYM